AAEHHLDPRKREIWRDAKREAKWKARVLIEAMAREEDVIVEDRRIAEKGQVQRGDQRRERRESRRRQRSGRLEPIREHHESYPRKKKGAPKGALLLAIFCDYEPRQEPGRYLEGTVVPSVGRPQRHWLIAIGPALRLAATATVVELTIGTSVTAPAGRPPPVVTETLPLSSVATLATYFDVWVSQPQLPAPGGVPPVW